MSALPLISECNDKGIKIRVEGSEIILSAPKGTLTPDLVTRVKEEKPALLVSLRKGRKKDGAERDDVACRKACLRPVQCVDMLARKLWRCHYDELRQQAGDSWAMISIDPDRLMDFAHCEATRRILKAGRMPDTFTAVANCRKCGLVPVDAGLPNEIAECPWCMNGLTPPPLPKPPKGELLTDQ